MLTSGGGVKIILSRVDDHCETQKLGKTLKFIFSGVKEVLKFSFFPAQDFVTLSFGVKIIFA
jgi:hypothetical protein